VHLHADDAEWIMRSDPAIELWEGETKDLGDGLTLIRCGGHYAGGTVLHWAAGAEGRGALLSGDIVQVVPDVAHVGFMYSYPNLIPLPEAAVARIAQALEPYAFEVIYGAWWGRFVPRDAKAIVSRSAQRYSRALRGEMTP
jgi:glyoxylase-like metal-dependent hydrolase (beta-lactamase superfamily II)